jgi:hypothetical protein
MEEVIESDGRISIVGFAHIIKQPNVHVVRLNERDERPGFKHEVRFNYYGKTHYIKTRTEEPLEAKFNTL